jgi:hypothetical protein
MAVAMEMVITSRGCLISDNEKFSQNAIEGLGMV